MRLYIMRHGPAEDHAASGRDFDRALTASGRDRVRDVAKVLVEEDEHPLVLVSSSLVRALQTAEIVANVANVTGPVETRRELSPGGAAMDLVREIVTAGTKRVMLVGHEPDLGELAGQLAGRSFAAGLQKAMVVGLATRKEDPARLPMTLRFVLEPKTLTWEHDAR
jgi:phosphohistidine phosphatase